MADDAFERRLKDWRRDAIAFRLRMVGRRAPSLAARRLAAEQAALEEQRRWAEASAARVRRDGVDSGAVERTFGVSLVEIDDPERPGHGVAVAARRSAVRHHRGRWTDEQRAADEKFAQLAAAAARIGAMRGCLAERAVGAPSDRLIQCPRRARMVADFRQFQRVLAAVPRAPVVETALGPVSPREVLEAVSLGGAPLSAFGAGRRYKEARALLEAALGAVSDAVARIEAEPAA